MARAGGLGAAIDAPRWDKRSRRPLEPRCDDCGPGRAQPSWEPRRAPTLEHPLMLCRSSLPSHRSCRCRSFPFRGVRPASVDQDIDVRPSGGSSSIARCTLWRLRTSKSMECTAAAPRFQRLRRKPQPVFRRAGPASSKPRAFGRKPPQAVAAPMPGRVARGVIEGRSFPQAGNIVITYKSSFAAAAVTCTGTFAADPIFLGRLWWTVGWYKLKHCVFAYSTVKFWQGKTRNLSKAGSSIEARCLSEANKLR